MTMDHRDLHLRLPAPLPERLELPATARAFALAAVLLGGAVLAWAFGTGRAELAWSAYLIGVWYVLGLGVFGVLWISILYLCRGVWSVSMRRLPEAMTGWLLPGGILALLVAMVPRAHKREPRPVMAIAAWILAAQVWELFLMVAPAVGHGADPAHGHLPLAEYAVAAGFLGLFYLVFEHGLRRHAPVPLKDPGLQECLEYHAA
ncbi:MAG: hypothetical protein AB1505_34555 [Candidatus Latescibacterota bacterium]